MISGRVRADPYSQVVMRRDKTCECSLHSIWLLSMADCKSLHQYQAEADTLANAAGLQVSACQPIAVYPADRSAFMLLKA